MNRSSGILLPISSLPSNYGIGCFSESAYRFVDFLADAGQSYWQILPMGPTGYGDSPYQSFSAFAGNPYFISLEELIRGGILTEEECREADFGDKLERVDYEKLYRSRYPLLRRAAERCDLSASEDYAAFERANADWLEDYALFMAIKESFGGKSWLEWDSALRLREDSAIREARIGLADAVAFHKFMQFMFFSQWYRLKDYANRRGVRIIGDIPIYVALDSADTWLHPELFLLDSDRRPTSVAGCPPDGFSPTGQLWGNPLYRWDYHRETNYAWWIRRLEHSFSLYDVVRIDHFRGFDEYYSIPYGRENAIEGRWERGPGIELFHAVENALGKREVVAEDLGFMTDSVRNLLMETGFPGMKVLEFAFDVRDTGSKNDYLPHNYGRNCVAYTGTHDNQTLSAWLETIPEGDLSLVRDYLCDAETPADELNLPLIALIMRSAAELCVVPLQDYLGYGDESRINEPSTLGGNWEWRVREEALTDKLKTDILRLTTLFGRKAQG